MTDLLHLLTGFLVGVTSSAVFILALFIGFCTVFGFTKLVKTSRGSRVIKSLDEVVSGEPFVYLTPAAPHGPIDQLHTPEPRASAARKS